MSVRVDRRALGVALARARPIVRGSGPIEILRLVLLDSRPDASSLAITGTDVRLTVSAEVACETSSQGLSVLVDPMRLGELCGSEWAEELELEVAQDGRLVVKGETETRFAGRSAEDFPLIPEMPADGWVGMSGEVVEALGRAAGWCEGEGAKRYAPVLARFVWLFGAGDGRCGVMGGAGHASLCRYLPGPGEGLWVIGKECAALVAGLAKGGGIEMAESATRHFFRGPGWWVSEAKSETDGADPRRWLGDPRVRSLDPRPLPAMGNLIKVLDAMPRKVAGLDRRVALEAAATEGGCRFSLIGPEVEWSGESVAPLPPYCTHFPEDFLGMLRELDRIAGTELLVEVGLFGGTNLRFEIAGEAVAFLSGATQ